MIRMLSARRNAARLRHLLRRFRAGRSGVAMVEFAMVLPAMIAIFFGVAEVAQGVMMSRKVTLLARTLADLTSQAATISDSERNNIFDAAGTVMAPYASPPPGMRMTSVVVDSGGVARVCWSEARGNLAALARGNTVVIPAPLRQPNTSVIVARATHDFTPAVGHFITGTITLGNDDIYMRPRYGKIGGTGSVEQVERTGRAMCPT